MTITTPKPPFALITLVLPGPDRKRSPAAYHYRVTYRNPEPGEPGCVMTWDVVGGRDVYQVALERAADDFHRWHCTCEDAVYRHENQNTHFCKHVTGLIQLFDPLGTTVRRVTARAA
jgi:hypothetical protein